MNDCDKTNEDAMRINERALASYSVSSATPVDRAGWLWKRGEVNREGVLANFLRIVQKSAEEPHLFNLTYMQYGL